MRNSVASITIIWRSKSAILAAKSSSSSKRCAIADNLTGQVFDLFETAFQATRIRIAALKFEQIFGAGPAFIEIADQVFFRHFHVLEKHLVDLLRTFAAGPSNVTSGDTVTPGACISMSRNEMPS
jgi:hypothetical protein